MSPSDLKLPAAMPRAREGEGGICGVSGFLFLDSCMGSAVKGREFVHHFTLFSLPSFLELYIGRRQPVFLSTLYYSEQPLFR